MNNEIKVGDVFVNLDNPTFYLEVVYVPKICPDWVYCCFLEPIRGKLLVPKDLQNTFAPSRGFGRWWVAPMRVAEIKTQYKSIGYNDTNM